MCATQWVAVRFSPVSGAISGCEIKPYLLELSRVVGQSSNERNYHAFYQAQHGVGSDAALAQRLGLSDADRKLLAPGWNSYTQTCTSVDGIDDGAEWRATRAHLDHLGLGERSDELTNLLLAILALGNVTFSPPAAPGDGPCTCAEAEAAARLLGVPPEQLAIVLVHRLVHSGRGSMYQVCGAAPPLYTTPCTLYILTHTHPGHTTTPRERESATCAASVYTRWS